jgi:predicted nucleotidyltransferase component of viral defense system
MADKDPARIELHADVPLFREAVEFTAAKTGFNRQVIEKDYFCTVLLEDLTRHGGPDLIFKGGTCLAKVHAGFYRLSEDLDFAIPMPTAASRTERSRATDAIKEAVAEVSRRLPGFECTAKLQGANNSSQYNGVVSYRSILTGGKETILVDVSVREPALTPPQALASRTVILDPINGQPAVPIVRVNCIDVTEAMAEKFRAALTRDEVAIRDFYDLDYAVQKLSLDAERPSFVDMVRRKLAIPDIPRVDVSADRMAELRRQVEPKLKTVLRAREFRDFDLDRAIAIVVGMAERLR